jgi:two-component system, LytTR family, sensor kinase
MDEAINNLEEQSRAERLLQKLSVRLALIWGIWALAALFFATQVYMMYLKEERRIPFSQGLFLQGLSCAIWALATPLVLWLARRFRIERNNWRRTVPFHFVVGVALVSSMIVVDYVLYMSYLGRVANITPLNIFQNVYYNVDRLLLTYWVIVLISHAFNYYNSYRKGELKAAQLGAQLAQSQLEALKMQLHPHFLFNTLHSISALLNKDVEGARSMIARLGDFLRLTLENGGSQEVTLQQEIEFLNGYLDIERIRFQDRLTTLVRVDPTVLDVRVPNLILQPLVENAMRHAIANSDRGRIEVLAEPSNGMLRIQVKDNGPGLQVIRAYVNRSKGVGLTNTKARLDRLYGSAHRLEFENEPNGGLVVTMEIPRHAKQPQPS